MKNILSLLVACLLASSCSTKFSLQKRKYTRGFYFASLTSKKQDSKLHQGKNATTQLKNEGSAGSIETVIVSVPASEKNNRLTENKNNDNSPSDEIRTNSKNHKISVVDKTDLSNENIISKQSKHQAKYDKTTQANRLVNVAVFLDKY